MLTELIPNARSAIFASMFNPGFPGINSSQQVGLPIWRLRKIVEGTPLVLLPGIPEKASLSRQLSFLAGRLCVEYLFTRQGAPTLVQVDVGASGEPLWPEGWTGSITHTNELAFAVAMRRNSALDVGIDAETIFDEPSLIAVMATCVSSGEHALVDATGNTRLAATVLFTAKEAYYKAIYRQVRRVVDFREVALTSLDMRAGTFELGPLRGCDFFPAIIPSMCGRYTGDKRLVMSCILPNETLD